MDHDRRQFPRLHAPVLCRPVGGPLFGRRPAIDVSLGGMRLYTDDTPTVGERLELELFLPEQGEIVCSVEIMWVETLAADAGARFDVGVKFVDISDADHGRLTNFLRRETPDRP